MRDYLMGFLLLCMVLGLIPAFIAHSKGRSAFPWWIYSSALFVIALPHSLSLSSAATARQRDEATAPFVKPCPFCAERIRLTAIICRYCQGDLRSLPYVLQAREHAGKMAEADAARAKQDQDENQAVAFKTLRTTNAMWIITIVMLIGLAVIFGR
jgi:hypothetical protein